MLAAVSLWAATASADTSQCSQVSDSIRSGQNWIVQAQKPNGLFLYEYNIAEARAVEADNIVRQIGTFWALIQSHRHHPTKASANAIDRFRKGIDAFIVEAKAGAAEVAFIRHQELGKLNSVALYTVALLDLEKAGFMLSPREKELLPKLVHGMREMAHTDGGFWYIYYLPQTYNRITPYGTGEALYALAKYYNATQDKKNMRWVYDTFKRYYARYIVPAEHFRKSENAGFFSWGIYTLSEISQQMPVDYHAYVRPILDRAFDFRANNSRCQGKGCLFDTQVTDAVFLEGMVEAYRMAKIAKEKSAYTWQLQAYIHQAIALTRDLQIHDVSTLETRLGKEFTGDAKHVMGAFCINPTCRSLRTDLNQHALIALYRYHGMFCRAANNAAR